MKKKIEEFINFLRLKGVNILELLNQNYFFFFYSSLIINLILISIIFYKELYIIGLIFSFTLIIILKTENLIKIGEINLYDKANKKILFLNLILLIINIINLWLNVFRYIFYDIIKIIREFARNILLTYFQIEISNKMDFYIDNIVAYISFDVVWISFTILLLIYYLLYLNKYFDWKREDILYYNDQLKAKLFWTHRNKLFLYTYIYIIVYIWCFFILFFLKEFEIIYIDVIVFSICVRFYFLSLILYLIFKIQFKFNYYKFHWRKNKEYLKWKD